MISTTLLLAMMAQAPAAKPSSPSSTPKPSAPATAAPAAGTPARKPATAQAKPAARATAPYSVATMTDEQKTIYALGLMMQRSITPFDLSAAELDLVKRALADGAAGKPGVNLDEWGPKVQALARDRGMRVVTKQKAVSAEYVTKAATEAGAVRTDTGLVYTEISAGTGVSPTAADSVKVNYRGTLIDGTEFDSSYKRGEPAQFSVGGVIKCWTEGLQRTKAGGKARLVCPSDLAYGDRGTQGIPGGAALIFEVDLLEVIPSTPRPPEPVR